MVAPSTFHSLCISPSTVFHPCACRRTLPAPCRPTSSNLRRREKLFAAIAIILSIPGQVGIILVAVFNTVKHHTLHFSMLIMFLVCTGVSVLLPFLSLVSLTILMPMLVVYVCHICSRPFGLSLPSF